MAGFLQNESTCSSTRVVKKYVFAYPTSHMYSDSLDEDWWYKPVIGQFFCAAFASSFHELRVLLKKIPVDQWNNNNLKLAYYPKPNQSLFFCRDLVIWIPRVCISMYMLLCAVVASSPVLTFVLCWHVALEIQKVCAMWDFQRCEMLYRCSCSHDVSDSPDFSSGTRRLISNY